MKELDMDLLRVRFCFKAGSKINKLLFSGDDSVLTCLLLLLVTAVCGFASILTFWMMLLTVFVFLAASLDAVSIRTDLRNGDFDLIDAFESPEGFF
jgi:hypothetical protein